MLASITVTDSPLGRSNPSSKAEDALDDPGLSCWFMNIVESQMFAEPQRSLQARLNSGSPIPYQGKTPALSDGLRPASHRRGGPWEISEKNEAEPLRNC